MSYRVRIDCVHDDKMPCLETMKPNERKKAEIAALLAELENVSGKRVELIERNQYPCNNPDCHNHVDGTCGSGLSAHIQCVNKGGSK